MLDVHKSSYKSSSFLTDFNQISMLSTCFCKNMQCKMPRKCHAGAEFFHADGQTYKKKQVVVFRNFANTPKH
jgi:hypothetical protein